MSEISTQTIRVWTGDIERRKFTAGHKGQRVYATRRVYLHPDGVRVPVPNSWELLSDEKFVTKAGRVYFPEFDLEPRAEDGAEGIQLYACVTYDAQGREQATDGSTFTLPADFAPEVNFYDVFERYLRSIGEWYPPPAPLHAP